MMMINDDDDDDDDVAIPIVSRQAFLKGFLLNVKEYSIHKISFNYTYQPFHHILSLILYSLYSSV